MKYADGWNRSSPARVVNFLGRTAVDTYQLVTGPDGQRFYCRRDSDTRNLEIRYAKRTTTFNRHGYMLDDHTYYGGDVYRLLMKFVYGIINI